MRLKMGTMVGLAFENGNGGWFCGCKWERWLVLRLKTGIVVGFAIGNGNGTWFRV